MNVITDVTPLIVALVVLEALAAIALAGGTLALAVPFFGRHRAVRLHRGAGFVRYYRGLALHH